MKLHAPVLSAVGVPSVMVPSLIVTAAPASPVPLTAGFDVSLSPDELPVSKTKPIERAVRDHGCVVSSCGSLVRN